MAPIALGPFVLSSPVARGGMGEVWAGEHPAEGLPVAVKVLTASRSRDRGFRDAFLEEARAVAGLDHGGVVRVFDFGEVDLAAAHASRGRLVAGTPYLVMELVDGGSLSGRKGALGWTGLGRVLVDLLGALAHAHSRGVVHRDIKPGNILVAADGTIKVTDFGLAHALSWTVDEADDREPVRLGGTPQYMAPEQLRGEWRDFGPWTDLYAVGCTAWALCTGAAPFSEHNRLEVMRAHLTRELPSLEPRQPVPPGFEEWLAQLLDKDPGRRFGRAADAAWALLALGEPTEDAPYERDVITEALGARTTLFWTEADLPPQAAAPRAPSAPVARDRGSVERPPVPADWRALPPRASDLRVGSGPLLGAGLGLYGLRHVPLVGRDDERDQLWNALRQSRRGCRALVMTGPLGSGKGRLAQWLCERGHEVGAVTVLRADHGPDSSAASGLRRMVSRHLGCLGLDRLDVEDRVRRWLWSRGVVDEVELNSLCALIAPGLLDRWIRHADPAQRHAVGARLLQRVCEERPVVLWIDDAQWGADTLAFALHVLDHHPDLPVLVLVSARDEALADRPGEMSTLVNLAEHPRGERLDVQPLSAAESATLVRELLGLAPELADRVQARTRGNPGFAVQLVGDWVARGVLTPAREGFTLAAGARTELPDDLYGAWGETLARLARRPASRSALEIAAALGHEVDPDLWRDTCRRAGASDPVELAERLVQNRLMVRRDGRLHFVHPMLRESIARTAREQDRWAGAHRACAETLQALDPHVRDTEPARLGRHLLDAGQPEEAEGLLLEGVRRLLDGQAFREAVALLGRRERAMERLDLDDADPRVVAGHLARASVYNAQGRPRLAEGWLERAAPHATGALAAEAQQLTARLATTRGDLDLAERTFLDAAKGFRDARMGLELGDCLAGLAGVTRTRGRLDRARTLCTEALARFRDAGAESRVAFVSNLLADVYRLRGELDDALPLCHDAREIYTRLGMASGLAAVERQLGILHTLRREPAEGRAHLARSLELYEQLGNPDGQHGTLNALAEIERMEGRLGTAEDLYRRALSLAESVRSGEVIVPHVNLGLVILRRGRHDEALAVLDRAAATCEEIGMDMLLGGVDIARVACHAALGDLEGVERCFLRGRRLLDQTGAMEPDVAWAAELAGETLWDAGATDWARATWELAVYQFEGLGHLDDAARVSDRLRSCFGTPTPQAERR